jgi:hypothetical protein
VSGSIDAHDPARSARARVDVAAARTPEPPVRRRERAQSDARLQPDVPSLGELKAQHREQHLCFRCNHHMVCGMAKALDPNLLVAIASCLAFEPEGFAEPNDVRERLPVESLPARDQPGREIVLGRSPGRNQR